MLAAIIVAGLCCSCTDQPSASQATNLTTTTQQMTTNSTPTSATTTSATTTSATTATNKKILSVQNILQNPELPTGCEVTSATILLNYYGYNVDKVWLCDNFLPKSTDFHGSYGPDPNKVFVGNPKSSSGRGLYCHAPVIVKTINDYLRSVGSNAKAMNITGTSAKDLESYIAQGTPVGVWATINMVPTKEIRCWALEDGGYALGYNNFHCLVLIGYDDDYYYFADPLGLSSKVDKNTFISRYETLRKQAVIIVPE